MLDLLTANYTFVDERLAKHYGIPNVTGSAFRRVPITDEPPRPARPGQHPDAHLVAEPHVAGAARQMGDGSAARRAAAAAAADVPALKEKTAEDGEAAAGARADGRASHEPGVRGVPQVMDPIGLALENFDAIGPLAHRRQRGAGRPTGELYDGTQLDGPVGLRQALLKHRDVFVRSFTENLLTYALGRGVEYLRHAGVRAIVRDAAKNDNRFSSFVLGIVKSARVPDEDARKHADAREAANAE